MLGTDTILLEVLTGHCMALVVHRVHLTCKDFVSEVRIYYSSGVPADPIQSPCMRRRFGLFAGEMD